MDDDARPIAHIGYHKTATTWFQECFYPAVRNGTYVKRRIVRGALIEPTAFSFRAEAARSEINEAANGRRALLCEENLSGYLHNGGLGGLLPATVAVRLQQVMPDARIVVFLREQGSAVAASYAQYVRSGGTRSVRQYLNAQSEMSGARSHWYKVPLFDLNHFSYAPLLEHYAGIFGKEAVEVFLYEEFLADRTGFIRRYCERLGLSVELDSLDFSPRNASLSPAGIGLMRRLNRFTRQSVLDKDVLFALPDWYERRWKVARRLLGARLEGSARADQILGPDLVGDIRDHFARGNAQLATQWQLPVGEFGYPIA
jgi:hypothetical protein